MNTDIIQVTFSLFRTGEGEFKACRRVGTLGVSERKVDGGNGGMVSERAENQIPRMLLIPALPSQT